MTKGILKRHSFSGVSVTSSLIQPSATPDDSPKPKRVSFDGAEPARVFEADEWDRSPAEITLRLTYKDVVELRELNASLVRNGPLMMERTSSRRPTRQRTPTLPSSRPLESPARSSPRAGSPISLEGPISDAPGQRLSPTYPYRPFTSQTLPPLLEDASPAASPSPSPKRRGHGYGVSASDSYFTFQPVPPSGSPPGLPICAARLKSLPSPPLMPPSPLALSSPPARSSSPKPAPRFGSPLPVYFPHSSPGPLSPRPKVQSTSGSPKAGSFSALSRRASVPEELALEAKALLSDSSLRMRGASPTWKPLGSTDVHANSSKPPLSSPALVQGGSALARKNTLSLMGWELRRTGGGNGKRGFGLVRKGSGSA